MQLIVIILWIALIVLAGRIVGRDAVVKQLNDALAPMNQVLANLPDDEADFLNVHVKFLLDYNSTKCDQCKNSLKYAKLLMEQLPDKKHLISLTLYKYCLDYNKGDKTKCDLRSFFVTTNSLNFQEFNSDFDSGIHSNTTVNLYDNDFIGVMSYFNMSSEYDLDSYCYFQYNSVCSLPEVGNVTAKYDMDSWWPPKQPQHYSEPIYTRNNSTFNVVHFSDAHDQIRYKVGSETFSEAFVGCLPESYNKTLPGLKNYDFTTFLSSWDQNYTKSDNFSFYPLAYYDENNTYIPGDYYDYPKYRGYDFVSFPAMTFGGYACDSPEVLVNSTLKNIAKLNESLNFEFSMFTGDVIDHDQYHITPSFSFYEEMRSYDIFKHYLKDIRVFPTLGNHDSFPYAQVPQQKYNHTDFDNAKLVTNSWVQHGWIGNMSNLTIHYAGFSFVTERGLKIISLNSNCYYDGNLWAFINLEQDPDSFGQWKWLVDELIASENANQRVWIMAHVPTAGGDAIPVHSHIFAKIVQRFSPYTIANIFFGHTHQDHFRNFYDDNGDPLTTAWVGQSISPLAYNNPGWKYYEVEDESFNIRNANNYYFMLNETYIAGNAEPEWKLEYSAREAYDEAADWPLTAPLNATFWDKFVVQKLNDTSNIEVNQKFANHQFRNSPFVPQCLNKTTSNITTLCYFMNYCVVGNYLADEYSKCVGGAYH